MKIATTTVTQTANAILGTKEKTLYYLIIENSKEKMIINVGEKTNKLVEKLITEDKKEGDKKWQTYQQDANTTAKQYT